MLRRRTRCILEMPTVSPGHAMNTYGDAAAQTSLSSLAYGEFLSAPADPFASSRRGPSRRLSASITPLVTEQARTLRTSVHGGGPSSSTGGRVRGPPTLGEPTVCRTRGERESRMRVRVGEDLGVRRVALAGSVCVAR